MDSQQQPSSLNLNNSNHLQQTNNSMEVSLVRNQSTSSSFKELKKDYNLKKKHFTRNIETAIESSQEVHSGWLKARTTFKRWTKVWCQAKPGYLVMYTSQEAQKKHRLGVVLLSVCQVIKRPTKKDGFCFKLINPFGYSVWAKSSTRALAFSQASLTLRSPDPSIGRLWLDAFHQCNLSANLEGCKSVLDDADEAILTNRGNHSYLSDSDDDDDDDGDNCSTRQAASMALGRKHNTNNNTHLHHHHSNNTSNNNSQQSLNMIHQAASTNGSGRPFMVNGNSMVPSNKTAKSSQLGNNKTNHQNSNSNSADVRQQNCNPQEPINFNVSKMVAKFSKYNWRELNLENVNYVADGQEELGSAGVQNEEVHDSNKSFLWHIIRQLRPGMDLSKVVLPTFILEPRSFLEKLADYYYHCDILSEAILIDDPVLRLINIVKWYLSGFYKKPKGPKKPYNPILGERFRCFWDHPKTRSRTFFIAEQVSHHPPISAFYVTNRKDGYTISCTLLSRSKYLGNSVSAILDGKAKLFLNRRNETYTLTMPYANCKGILLGSLSLELGGKVEIECLETGCKCELDFELSRIWAGANAYNALTGKVFKGGKVTHTLEGHWDKKINMTNKQTNEKSVLWEVTDAVRNSRLKRYTVAVSDQGERESVNLWSKVTEALVAGDQTVATAEKTRLEDMQRQEARDRTGTFVPEHFGFAPKTNDYFYRWQDDRPWNERRDIMQFEDNFKIKTLMLNTPSKPNGASTSSSSSTPDVAPFDPIIDLPLTQMNRFSNQLELEQPGGDKQSRKIPSSRNQMANNNLHEQQRSPPTDDPFKSIESKLEAENMLIKKAIQEVNEKNRELEEDLATLKQGKKAVSLLMFAVIIAILSVLFKYFSY